MWHRLNPLIVQCSLKNFRRMFGKLSNAKSLQRFVGGTLAQATSIASINTYISRIIAWLMSWRALIPSHEGAGKHGKFEMTFHRLEDAETRASSNEQKRFLHGRGGCPHEATLLILYRSPYSFYTG